MVKVSTRALTQPLRRFGADKRGNVALITGLSIVPIIVMAGGTQDYSRAAKEKASIQVALDNSVVAAANTQLTDDPAEAVERFMKANFRGLDNDDVTVSVEVEEYVNGRRVSATATKAVDTLFLGVIGRNEIVVSAKSVASQYVRNTEISLVLDVSSSMNGNRLTSMKSAVETFIDGVLTEDTEDYTSVNIVPFGGTVNIGDLFDDYVIEEKDAIIDPGPDDYNTSNLPLGKYRFSQGGKCLEYDDNDFDTEELPANGRSQVPQFWVWWNFNPYCPDEQSAVMLNSSDKDALIDHVQGMTLSDGTGQEDGALWGLKALSPSMRGKLGGDFSNRPFDFSTDETTKVLVLMADGGITAQYRPRDYSYYNTSTISGVSDPTQTVGQTGKSSSVKRNFANRATALKKGNINSGTNNAVGRFLEVRDQAKANNVAVYTIGFQINNNSDKNILIACASSESNYYDVESLDITSAFQSIAASVDALRIEQ